MLKLMKYEFRKEMFSKLLLLGITGIMELIFLAGVFWEKSNALGGGIAGLSVCAVVGIMYIGIESILTFHKDLNTKQSYMLFMTPNSSYKILGAKVLENGIAILAAGLFFAALAAIDVSVAVLYIGGLEQFLNMLKDVMMELQISITMDGKLIFILFLTLLVFWMMTIATAYLAIVLSATVLSGKKFSGFVSFLIFCVLNGVYGRLTALLPDLSDVYVKFTLIIGLNLCMVIIMYVITAWIMDKKLSV